MKFRMHVANATTPGGWWEDHNMNCGNAQEAAREMINKFNATLQPGELQRTLLEVEITNTNLYTRHEWRKTNMVTIRPPRGRSHDTYQCIRCGITGKRFGLGERITRDKKFQANVYEDCDTTFAHLEKRRARNA